MKPSFSKKLITNYLLVVTVSLLLTGGYLTYQLKSSYLTHLEQSLVAQDRLMVDLLKPLLSHPETPGSIQAFAQHLGGQMGCRVTVIRADGQVLGDSERTPSEVVQMDNHLHRPEVQAALAEGSGHSLRYSRTLEQKMLYVALPVRLHEREKTGFPSPWGVLRVALPLTEVDRRIESLQKDLLKAGIVAFLVAFLVAWLSARNIVRPLRILTAAAQGIGEGRFPGVPAVPSLDEFGQLAQAFGAMSSRIQEKVRELSQERTQLSAILSALVESVVAVDFEGRVLFVNQAAERLFQTRASDIKGRRYMEVLRYSALNQILKEALDTRQPVSMEISLHSPEEHLMAVNTLPLSYGEDRAGVLVAMQEITELRKLERLRQEFVANVSHELKTPLTAIKGYVETLRDGALEDPQHNREFLKIIEDHANHLARLIDDVLDLSAIEAKRMAYRLEPVSLGEITASLIKGMAPTAKTKGVTLDNQLTDALPKVYADRDKLAQILMNLLDNAIKFNTSGGRVEIRAQRVDGTVAVTVHDTGVGIDEEHLPRVFERFYRADKARSHNIAGTGLGLAIVKHLVEAHQGTVRVESKPGKGASFTFTLPAA